MMFKFSRNAVQAKSQLKKSATTSIHEQPVSLWKEHLVSALGWFLLSAALVMMGWVGYMLYHHIEQAKITHVEIKGLSPLSQQFLINYLHPDMTGNYFNTDLEQIRDKALSLSWVDRIVVARHWPDGLVLEVTPRHAIARWGTERLLSDDGVVFKPVDADKQDAQLPLLHGPVSQTHNMMMKYRDISQMFYPLRLEELYLTERMTWFMKFNSGLRIVVDQDQTMYKLQRLNALAVKELKPVWEQIAAVDLRYRNGLTLQWKHAKAPKIENGHFIIDAPDSKVTDFSKIDPSNVDPIHTATLNNESTTLTKTSRHTTP